MCHTMKQNMQTLPAAAMSRELILAINKHPHFLKVFTCTYYNCKHKQHRWKIMNDRGVLSDMSWSNKVELSCNEVMWW